jgi:hypothetical protein
LKVKVNNTINIWKIFNLSLTGKLTIVKTLVYPILNYYLSILTPDPEWLNEIDILIENFVTGGMNIGKEKLYRDPAEGGLGMFKSDIFFKALKVSWIRRCLLLTHDNWRRKVFSLPDPGVPFIQEADIINFGPLLSGILTALISFRNAYGTYHNNYLTVPILNNNFFFINNGRMHKYLDTDNFRNIFPGLGEAAMRKLCWKDLAGTGNLQSINQLSEKLGFQLTAQNYRILEGAFKTIKKLYAEPSKNSLNFVEFLGKKFKGSKLVRKIFTVAWIRSNNKKNTNPYVNFCKIAGVAETDSGSSVNAIWTTYYFPSDLKTFLFKLHHNIIGINSRVHHFNME